MKTIPPKAPETEKSGTKKTTKPKAETSKG